VQTTDLQAQRSIVLFDRLTGVEVRRFALGGPYGVAADGSLFVAQGQPARDGCGLTLTRYAPPSFAPTALAVNVCARQLSAADASVLAVAAVRGRRTLIRVDSTGARREVADLGPQGLASGKLDYEGDTGSYALRECDGRDGLFVASTSQAVPETQPLSCPVQMRSRRANGRRGRVAVRVICRRGCVTRVELFRRGRRLAASGRVSLRPRRRSQRVRLKLTRPARRLVRRQRALGTVVTLRPLDRAGRRSRTSRRPLLLLR